MIEYGTHITASEWIDMRAAVGFGPINAGQAARGIQNTAVFSVARENGRIVGMARSLYDGCYSAYIADVLVRPEYQRKGIGKQLVRNVLSALTSLANPGETLLISLTAARGKEPFYEPFGFSAEGKGPLGHGMSLHLEIPKE